MDTEDAALTGSETQEHDILPSTLAEKILWRLSQPVHESTETTNSSTAAPNSTNMGYTLPDDTVLQVRSLVAQAFSLTAQAASVDLGTSPSKLPDPNITLYCPFQHCHEIIDNTVKAVATIQGADVVVLDSLELAKGTSSVFGKDALAEIEMMYGQVENSKVQKVFDDIVNLELNSALPGTKALKRIIYMRDFGAIAKSALSLIFYILQAVRKRRVSKLDANQSSSTAHPLAVVQPTIIIFGICEDLQDHSEYHESILIQGGNKLGSIVNPLNDVLKSLSDTELFPFVPSLPSLTARFFLPYLVLPSQRNSRTDHHLSAKDRAAVRDDMKFASYCLCVVPPDVHSVDFEILRHRISNRRRKDVWNAWITIFLEQKQGKVDADPIGSIIKSSQPTDESMPTEDQGVQPLVSLATRTNVTVAYIVTRVVCLALGLAIEEAKGSETPVHISSINLGRAYELFVLNRDILANWLKKEKGDLEEKAKSLEKKAGKALIDPIIKKVKESNLTKHENQLLSCIVDAQNLQTVFDDVRISRHVIDSLNTVISLPLLHPEAFKTGILQREAIGGVLLYGPPGTGKTMVIRAVAHECKSRMLQIKPSDIGDMYLGETEKLVRAVFTLARRLAPCVIFIDELDALFSSRGSSHSWHRNMLIEFMQAMDGLQSAQQNKDTGVVVVGATNRPYDLDDAILRRLPTRMMVGLPGQEEREQILCVHLKGENLHADVKIPFLASKCIDYSGSDLKNLCVSAAMASVNEIIASSEGILQFDTKKEPAQGEYTKFPAGNTPAKTLDWKARMLCLRHFDHAFTEVLASSTMGSHAQLYKWHKTFGTPTKENNNT